MYLHMKYNNWSSRNRPGNQVPFGFSAKLAKKTYTNKYMHIFYIYIYNNQTLPTELAFLCTRNVCKNTHSRFTFSTQFAFTVYLYIQSDPFKCLHLSFRKIIFFTLFDFVSKQHFMK